MVNAENRQLFLNIKETFLHCEYINKIEIQPDDNYYTLSCVLFDIHRIAFGMHKQNGVAFIKVSLKMIGIGKDRVDELCSEVVKDSPQITYSFNGVNTVFTMVMPVQKSNFTSNNDFVFREVAYFIEKISKCCKQIGNGSEIYLEQKTYVKKESSSKSSNKEKVSATVDDSQKDVSSKKEDVQVKEDVELEEKHDDVIQLGGVPEEKTDINDKAVDDMMIGQIGIEDVMGDDLLVDDDQTTVSVSEFAELDEYEEEPEEKKENKPLYGSIPMDDEPELVEPDETDYVGGIEKDDEIVKDDDLPVDDVQSLDGIDQIPNVFDKIEEDKQEDNVSYDTADNLETKDSEKNEENIDAKSFKEPKEEASKKYDTFNNRTDKRDKYNEKKMNQSNQRNNKNKSQGGNSRMDEKRNNQSSSNTKISIFVNYERELRNLENKYRNQVRGMSTETLFSLIEGRYGNQYDEQGNIIDVPDYIKEKVCSMAKAELMQKMR